MGKYCNGENCKYEKESCPKYKNYKSLESTSKHIISSCDSGSSCGC